MGEAFTLAEKGGIEAETVQTLLKDLLPAPPCVYKFGRFILHAHGLHSLVNYGEKMVHDAFDGSKGFAIDGGIKDAT